MKITIELILRSIQNHDIPSKIEGGKIFTDRNEIISIENDCVKLQNRHKNKIFDIRELVVSGDISAEEIVRHLLDLP